MCLPQIFIVIQPPLTEMKCKAAVLNAVVKVLGETQRFCA